MTQLKSLIKEVERLKKEQSTCDRRIISGEGRYGLLEERLQGIKQTVEAVDNMMVNKWWLNKTTNEMKDWQKQKKLLGIK